jgi:hypothetical protein
MRVSALRRVIAIAGTTVGVLSCADSPTVMCPAILYQKLTVPDTTTIKVGASTIAIAGASWGGCETTSPAVYRSKCSRRSRAWWNWNASSRCSRLDSSPHYRFWL